MTTTSAEHWLSLGQQYDHEKQAMAPTVRGMSQWDMPDGNRLRREMRRSTLLQDEKTIRRWAKRFADVSAQDVENAVSHLAQR